MRKLVIKIERRLSKSRVKHRPTRTEKNKRKEKDRKTVKRKVKKLVR